MSNDKYGDAFGFCCTHEFYGAFTYLRYTPGSALNIGTEHGLNRVDDEEHRLLILDMYTDCIEIIFADDEKLICNRTKAVCTHANLTRTLLPCDIEYAPFITGNIR